MTIGPTITPDTLIERWDGLARGQTHYITMGGATPVPARVAATPGADTLLILFHGAVDRSKREYPPFLGERRALAPHAHQICLADTSLHEAPDITNGWFIGSKETPLQEILPPLFNDLKNGLGVKRVVFMGGSSGGFAALHYSSLFADSAAVVAVPQTNINAYYKKRADDFMDRCWGNGWREERVRPLLDLTQSYASGPPNSVVYLQSELDAFHLKNHMAPFVASLPIQSWDRVVLRCSYWGVPGHSGSVPSRVWDEWARAVVAAPDLSARSIIETHALLNETTNSPAASGRVAKEQEPSDKDLRISAQLAQELLRGQ